MDQDATRYGGLGPGDIVLDGDPAPVAERGTAPHFWAHVYCGQTIAHLSELLSFGASLRQLSVFT